MLRIYVGRTSNKVSHPTKIDLKLRLHDHVYCPGASEYFRVLLFHVYTVLCADDRDYFQCYYCSGSGAGAGARVHVVLAVQEL